MAESRRGEMLDAALDLFATRGYDGASIADLAEATGLTKAAFSYHFAGKDEILVELAEPLMSDLEALVDRWDALASPADRRAFLSEYLDALLRHRRAAIWIDGDKSVASHPVIGRRLAANNSRVRSLLAGPDGAEGDEVRASAVLGALWRPVRNLTDFEMAVHRDEVLGAALGALQGYDLT